MVINKKSLTDQVYLMIKKQILNHQLKLGEQLNTRKIAEQHDISLMPVRDALRRLSNEELVENKPRVGFFVKNFSETEINDILEVRKMQELYCLENYFSQIDKTVLAELKNIFIENEQEHFSDADSNLHKEIIKASNNNYLIDSYLKMINHFTMLFSYLNDKRSETSRKEHIDLIDAIIEEDKKRAYKILFSHLDRVEIAEDANVKKMA